SHRFLQMSKAATIFRFDPDLGLETLHSFGGGEGYTLIQGRDGNFYGGEPLHGCGFRGFLGGSLFKFEIGLSIPTLHNFQELQDRCSPNALMQARDGSFYGTAGESLSEYSSCPAGFLFRLDLGLSSLPLLHRGDPNSSRTTDISDAITTFGFLFLGNPPTL